MKEEFTQGRVYEIYSVQNIHQYILK